MAATRIVEEERGTFTGSPRNAHQRYYAGDFSRRPVTAAGFARAPRYAERPATSTPTSGWL